MNSNQDSAKQLQEDSATGSNNGEQGKASFNTGSTTQGGSNYGQGSSHLGGESYQQGSTSNTGSNYKNEESKLGNSSTGTSEEGSSSATAGSGDQYSRIAITSTDTGRICSETARMAKEEENELSPKEGERRDTSLEKDSSVGNRAQRRPHIRQLVERLCIIIITLQTRTPV